MDFLANPVYLFESHGFTLFKVRLLICGKRTSRERFYAFSLALRKGFFVCVSLRPGEIWVKLLYGFPDSSVGKEPAYQSLGLEDPLEEEMATHSSILAWRIPWTEEPGGLQSMGLQRVGHN